MSPVDAINRLVVECSVRGWDSYDAEPITYEVGHRAMAAMTALSSEYTYDVVPRVDGGIRFEGNGRWDGVDLEVEP
jgi:hypothetical protein